MLSCAPLVGLGSLPAFTAPNIDSRFTSISRHENCRRSLVQGFNRVSAGTFSAVVAGVVAVVLSLGADSSLPGCGQGAASALPRMTGNPSLPVPITTIFELDDCAS